MIAELPGTEVGDNLPIVVIGAHYDSRSTDRVSPTQRAPGADDNGSGSAALVEMARIIHGIAQGSDTRTDCSLPPPESGLVCSLGTASRPV